MSAVYCQTLPCNATSISTTSLTSFPPPLCTNQYQPQYYSESAPFYMPTYRQHQQYHYSSPISPAQLPPQRILQYLSPTPSNTSCSPQSAHSPYSAQTTLSCSRSAGGRAVVIGINYFNQKGEMRGRVDEARNLHRYLVQCKRYRPEDIILLTDDQNGIHGQPTREHILKALAWLSQHAYPGERVVVYYSGHGRISAKGSKRRNQQQVISNEGEEETIYPVDFRCFKEGMIKGEVLQEILEPCRRKGAKLSLIIDTHAAVS